MTSNHDHRDLADDGADRSYSPFNRPEDRSYWPLELVCLLLAVAGLYLRGEVSGIALGVLLVTLWTIVRVEFVFATGVVLFSGLGGDPNAVPLGVEIASRGFDPGVVAVVLLLGGLGGLLAIDLGRSWGSLRPTVLFVLLFVLATVGIGSVYTSGSVPVHWIGLVAVATLAVVSYGLYQYGQFRFVRPSPDDDAAASPEGTTE
jgi:hypothetical protein